MEVLGGEEDPLNLQFAPNTTRKPALLALFNILIDSARRQ